MAKTQKIAQRRWAKGVNASASVYAQPPGSFPRASNLVYTRRGSLITADGSLILSAFGGVTPLTFDPLGSHQWRELFYYNPSTFLRTGYYGLETDPTIHLVGSTGTPVLSAATVSANGLTGTFFVRITAVDGVGGESAASPEAGPITLSNQGLTVTWTAVPNAYGYNIYVGNSSGTEILVLPPSSNPAAVGATVVGQAKTTVTLDSTFVGNPNAVPPTIDTTAATIFTAVPLGGWSPANFIHTFPASVGVVLTQTGGVIALDTGSLPVTTTTEVRPTFSVQGGPSGGSPNDYSNQQLAFDNNFATAAVANVPAGGNNGAQRTWSGFPGAPAGATTLTLNVSSSWQTSSPTQQTLVLISYSLVGGGPASNFRTLLRANASYPQSTASVALPAGQDLTLLRVTAYAANANLVTTGVSSIFEIWVTATTTVSSGGSSSSGNVGSGGGTANGGVFGTLGPLPEIVQFTDKMMLALGNGFPPYESDGSSAGTIPLGNTFQASYAARTPSTPQNVGDQIAVTIGTSAFIFTAVQAGTTAAGGPPAFSANISSIVADGTVYWKNSGAIAAVTPPRGAAHLIVYAGSLWDYNTFPGTTPDNFDGPSCLKMSDLNNPNSWNPLNVAFLDKDDGSEGMGLATFTIAESGIPPVGSLVAFKNFSTFQINGVFGASNFSIQRAQTDMGCSAPRTIQFVPGFGIVRLAHLGFAMFDGVRDRLLSEEIRPYLFGGIADIRAVDWGVAYFSKASQAASPPMYVCVCPLIGDGANLLGLLTGVSGSVVANTSSTLPTGTYFAEVGLRGPNGVTTLSGILGPFSITSGVNMIQIVTGTALPAGYSVFRVFFGTNSAQLSQFIDSNLSTINIASPGLGGTPPAGIPGAMTRIFAYDLVLKAWAIVDLPFAISVLHQTRIPGQQPQTVSGGFYDTTMRRLFYGDATFDGVPVPWSVRTPEVFGRNASDRTYFRELGIRGVGSPFGVSAQVVVSGNRGPHLPTRNVTVLPMGQAEFAAYTDIGVTGVDAYADLAGSGVIELQSVDWFAVAKSGRGRVVAG